MQGGNLKGVAAKCSATVAVELFERTPATSTAAAALLAVRHVEWIQAWTKGVCPAHRADMKPDSHDLDSLFAAMPISDMARQNLLRLMAEPTRFYHGRAHVELLWHRHKIFSKEAALYRRDELPIALAIAFHDAVYVGGASDNEARSAALWLEVSADENVCDESDRIWVADTILATADHLRAGASLDLNEPRARARQWMLDLDLTPLGDEPAVFVANMHNLAAELPSSPEDERRESLLATLRHFATACPLYRCAALRDAFEASAQCNFVRHLRHATDEMPVC